MNRLKVMTKRATYIVDRSANAWYRTSTIDPRTDDGEWNKGGFTIGEIGQSSYAHFDPPRADGALGRRTSRTVSVESIA